MAKLTRNISLRERLNISRLAIAYPWLTLSFWIAVTVAGILAFSSLKYALLPDITFPVVVVNASAPLQTALDTEAKLTQPLEQKLKSLPEIDEVDSSTYPSQAAVSLSFNVGTSLEESSRKVEAALKQLTLPQGTTFKIIPINLNESAAISYAIQSGVTNLTDLTKITKNQILPSIAKLSGVLKVELLGAAEGSAAQQTSEVRFNGQDALAFQVIKRGDANTLEVVSQVEKAVAQLQSTLPNVKLTLAATQAGYIREATQSTIDALGLAVALSVVVIFPFLWNWKATLISALAIPTSLLGTFIVMASSGLNLETITLLALALVIGIIVDDAIVDVENITQHLESGEPPRHAAIAATNEIGLTVTAATLTIVAVFLPVALMKGTIGQFFKPFGLTVSVAVLTSLLVARTLSPLLAVYWLKAPAKHDNKKGFQDNFGRLYRSLLSWCLSYRWLVLSLAVLSFAGGIALVPLIPKGFIPKLDRGDFNIVYAAGPTITLNESHEIAQKLEATTLRLPEIESVFTIIGSREGEPNKGKLYVKLRNNRQLHTTTVQDQLRQQLPVLAGVTTSIQDIQFVDTGDGDKPLKMALVSDDLPALNQTAQAIKARMEKLPGFADVSITGATTVNNQIIEIEHQETRRVAYISANLGKDIPLGRATSRMVAEAKAVLQALHTNVSLKLGGDSASSDDIFSSFAPTLGLSILCILLVLTLLFKSWADPLVIIFSLPLSIVGAVLALLLTRSEFGVISLIGIIFLMGLVNKNAILMVDYANQLRRSGLKRRDAILTAGLARLRPILMTTAATILGMLPIALGLGAGSELRAPMAIAIIGGLVTSTLLSLIVVPVVYALLDDWQPRFREKRLGDKGTRG